MKKFAITCTATAALLATGWAQATTLMGVDEVNNLISFDSAAPGITLSSVAITGLGGSSILALDLRVRTGVMYALTDDKGLYSVNTSTGAATLVNTLAITGSNFAMDFNPTNANLRLVSNDNSNYVYNFVSNALVPGFNVAYGVASPGLADPDIVGAAYTFNDNDLATGTTLFVLDSRNDVLATLNTATGTLTNIGSLGVNIGARTSFDITGTGNLSFVQAGSTLYSINLATGAMTALGNTDRALFGLAAPVPEPATWASLMLGLAGMGALMRARRSER
jgi:Domain of unknown function (DUF4394)/PEP-CTERM motif